MCIRDSTTRVAPSFLRVGQIELFARRVRNNAYGEALSELKMIVQHLIDRNYKDEIEYEISIESKVIKLASLYRSRLISLIANWMRVGYCQGNFNSDNCAAGGYTLDYGPLDSVNYLIQDFNHGQVEVNISHFLTNLLLRQSTLKHSVPLLVRCFQETNKIKKS